jgi:hypothetical protein
MTQSTINAQAGTTLIPALLNKSAGSVDNFAFQTNGANAISINQLELVVFNSNGAVKIPSGTTAQRPASPINGMLRYNTTLNKLEGYANNAWGVFT